jgi:hypothetical protein
MRAPFWRGSPDRMAKCGVLEDRADGFASGAEWDRSMSGAAWPKGSTAGIPDMEKR